MDLKGKTVTVVGLGNSGLNAALLLYELGAIVKATDAGDSDVIRKNANALKAKGIAVEIGVHTEGFVKTSQLVVVSPGVEDTSPVIRWALDLKIPIIGEMELGFRYCKGNILAITGTNGKTTVTTLIGRILKSELKDVIVCGNIGNSLCGEINRIKKDTWVVLEVSSFQLERIESFKPRIGIILNITDDHMDRYSRFDDYFKAKLNLFRNQDSEDLLILNYDAENIRGLKELARSKVMFYSRFKNTNGSYLNGTKLCCASSSGEVEICDIADIKLKGLHNVENVMASSLAGMLAGITPASIRRTVMEFKGLPHRYETVAIIKDVEYIDDSKGTTVDSTKRALESCSKPVILIAGGKDKKSNYALVKNIVKERVKHMVLIGEAAGAIQKTLGSATSTYVAKDMLEAVHLCASLAHKGDAVMLSPMCSSFDMFSSYKERGEVFKKAVEGLKAFK